MNRTARTLWLLIAHATLGAGCSYGQDPIPGDPDRCATHAACSNEDPCDGQERCEPSSADADARGCVPGEPPSVDDGVPCTVDACDPQTGLATHDASACGCQSDAQCQFERAAPCMAWTCNPQSQTCEARAADPGTPCEAGVACAPVGACDAQGACVPTPGDDAEATCDDGNFCNGQERCAPADPNVGPDGCAPGEPPAPPEEPPPACGAWSCDEDSDAYALLLGPTCECRADEDCPARGCKTYACDLTTGTCARQGQLDQGTPCDDGVECTFEERCDEAGECAGQPSVVWCALNRPCDVTMSNNVAACDPAVGCACVEP